MTPNLGLRVTVLGACLAALTPPASADDGAWRVGSSYVIRFEHLDLSRPADRQALLVQVERSAAKLCRTVRTKVRQEACSRDAVHKSLSAAPVAVKKAIQAARLERDGQQHAQR